MKTNLHYYFYETATTANKYNHDKDHLRHWYLASLLIGEYSPCYDLKLPWAPRVGW